MRFTSEVTVACSLAEVAAFLDDPSNLARWDRSVARVEPTSSGTSAVGFTFDTVAPSGMRMSYEITEHEPLRHTRIELRGSRMFRRAVWRMQYDAVPVGSRIICQVDFQLRGLYLALIVPLVLLQRSALRRDLQCLKQALEAPGYGLQGITRAT